MKDYYLSPCRFREITSPIPSNLDFIKNVDQQKYNQGQPLNKYWTFDFIETIADYIDFSEVKTIFDIGSRDGFQSLEFRNWFPDSKIIAFEGNPYQFNIINQVTQGNNIDVVMKCVGDYDGTCNFNLSPSNIGASSILKINDNKTSRDWTQHEINSVPIIRLDNFCLENSINTVDLLWIDVQGVELPVLQGLGDLLYNVKAICTEVQISPMYHGATSKGDLDKFLEIFGFIQVKVFHLCVPEKQISERFEDDCPEVDVIYINKRYLK